MKHNKTTAYLETFYEVTSWIESELSSAQEHRDEPNFVIDRYEQQGAGGKWELAEELTDEFEAKHEGVKWGEDESYPDWLDYLGMWLIAKNEDYIKNQTEPKPEPQTRPYIFMQVVQATSEEEARLKAECGDVDEFHAYSRIVCTPDELETKIKNA